MNVKKATLRDQNQMRDGPNQLQKKEKKRLKKKKIRHKNQVHTKNLPPINSKIISRFSSTILNLILIVPDGKINKLKKWRRKNESSILSPRK